MRKTKEITIDDRGTAKTFRITEMPATKFEWWIIQAGRALLGAGLGKELPGVNINSAEDVQEKVGNLLANEGLTALNNVDLDKIKPLYDQLLECCELKIDNFYTKLDPDTVDAQIESVKTLFTLRKEALVFHLDFLEVGAGSPSAHSAGKRGATINLQKR